MYLQPAAHAALLAARSASDSAVASTDLTNAYTALQTWYNESAGIYYPSTSWWNSANALTAIANIAAVDSTVADQATAVYENTYTNGPPWDIANNNGSSGFLNGYYDDEGWWGMAWIQVYDQTGNSTYLDAATTIFADMESAYDTTNCLGGLWWDKAHTQIASIANELYMALALKLATRVSGQQDYYTNLAQAEWSWFNGVGFIDPTHHLVWDHLNNSNCEPDQNYAIFTYNQGVLIGALVDLAAMTDDGDYITTAGQIANATIDHFGATGILIEGCEPNCDETTSQFKGVFMRNLAYLQKASPADNWATFLAANAASILANDQSGDHEFGQAWAGPYTTANATTQSSAMDALIAAYQCH